MLCCFHRIHGILNENIFLKWKQEKTQIFLILCLNFIEKSFLPWIVEGNTQIPFQIFLCWRVVNSIFCQTVWLLSWKLCNNQVFCLFYRILWLEIYSPVSIGTKSSILGLIDGQMLHLGRKQYLIQYSNCIGQVTRIAIFNRIDLKLIPKPLKFHIHLPNFGNPFRNTNDGHPHTKWEVKKRLSLNLSLTLF